MTSDLELEQARLHARSVDQTRILKGRELIAWAANAGFNGTHTLDIRLIAALRDELLRATEN